MSGIFCLSLDIHISAKPPQRMLGGGKLCCHSGYDGPLPTSRTVTDYVPGASENGH